MVGGSCGDGGGGSGDDGGGGNGRHHLSTIVVHHHPQHPLLPGEALLIFLFIFVSHVDHGRLGQSVTAHCKLLLLLLVWNWRSRRRITEQ